MSEVVAIDKEKQSILDKVAPVSERPPHVKGLVYGPPGVGKTVFCASAPNPLIIDVEHGTRSLLNHPELSSVPVLQVTGIQDITDVFSAFKAGEFPDIETIVIDSMSEYQKRHMDEHLKRAASKDRNRNPYLPHIADYKENTEYLRRLVIEFRDLEKNLLLTAHDYEDKDESSGSLFYRPAVTPKLAETLEGIMDFMGFYDLEYKKEGEKAKRVLHLAPTRRIRAKCRIGGLPDVIESPNFSDIIKAATENKKETE